jgi:zinc protease
VGESSDPLRIRYGTELDGLTVVRQASPPTAASCSLTYVAPAGWGYDPDGAEGTARLANQLVTSAAGRYDRVALARTLDRAGATLSRQCAPESAEVTIWGPASEWERLLGLLADVVLRPRFDPDDVARALRQQRERQLREQTQPAHRAERELLRSIFPSGHPYRATGLGSAASLDRITRARLVRFHREQYPRAGSLLVVTAPAGSAAVDRAARREFGGSSRGRARPLHLPPLRPRRNAPHRIDLPGQSQVEVRVGGASIPRSAPEFPAAFLANEVLGDRPLLNRLFQRVRESGGLAYHASSALESMRCGGYWEVQAGTGPGQWKKVVAMLEAEVERIRTEPIRSRDLALIRESAIGEIPLSLESTAEAHELAVEAAYYRLPEDHWIRWPALLRAVGPAEVRRAADRAFGSERQVTVVAGPLGARS